MPRLTIRIDFGDDSAFGPGKVRLLELIKSEGSIRRAAEAMDMSYRQAWLLLKETEASLGAPLTVSASGGVQGGGTTLSKAGRDVISVYRRIERQAARAAQADLTRLARLKQPTMPRDRRRS